MFAAALTLLTFAAAPVPKGAENSNAFMQGEWKIIKFLHDGEAEDLKKNPVSVTIAGNRMSTYRGPFCDVMTFTLDPTAKPPALNFTTEEGKRSRLVLAIYKIEGGVLTVCFHRDGVTRPTKFESLEESNTGLFVLERAKK
jgi:uncharacterized protein (TIGR03067 family)